jgi:hypothetical protein
LNFGGNRIIRCVSQIMSIPNWQLCSSCTDQVVITSFL